MSRTLEEETILYAIGTFILYGIPVIGFFSFLAYSNWKSSRSHLDVSDKDYKERYGELAYQEMLKLRQFNNGGLFAKAANSARFGLWFTRVRIDNLPHLIQANLATALIGNPPHRLANFIFIDNKISLSAQWPYPKNPKLTTVIELELSLAPRKDGGSSVSYRYSVTPDDDPFAAQIIEITNFWLKNLLEKAKEPVN